MSGHVDWPTLAVEQWLVEFTRSYRTAISASTPLAGDMMSTGTGEIERALPILDGAVNPVKEVDLQCKVRALRHAWSLAAKCDCIDVDRRGTSSPIAHPVHVKKKLVEP